MHAEISCPILMSQFTRKALKKGICHLSMSEIKIPTSQTEIIEARIVPKSSCYIIEIVYEKSESTTENQQVAGVDLGVNNLMAVTTNQTGISPKHGLKADH